MLEPDIIDTVRTYLRAVQLKGIPVKFGVVFGSQAKGNVHEWSDIDLVVVSPRYDDEYDMSDVGLLRRAAAKIDWRIEPIACGERAWVDNDSSIIYEVARREGEKVYLN